MCGCTYESFVGITRMDSGVVTFIEVLMGITSRCLLEMQIG